MERRKYLFFFFESRVLACVRLHAPLRRVFFTNGRTRDDRAGRSSDPENGSLEDENRDMRARRKLRRQFPSRDCSRNVILFRLVPYFLYYVGRARTYIRAITRARGIIKRFAN